MTLYRSKPATIEAVQWTGDNWPEIRDFGIRIGGGVVTYIGDDLELLAGMNGAQGWVPVPIGHWIVRNPGDFTDYWPIDPDYFAAKYELS